MPEPIDPNYQAYTPSGLVDSEDGNTSRQGAMLSTQNLIPHPETKGMLVCRPAAYALMAFAGFSSPGYVSVQEAFNNYEVGFVATSRNAGNDEPFIYDRSASSFLTIQNVTSANTPTSPATSGAWTPPTVTQVGAYFVFTHPGLSGNNRIAWLDLTGFSLATMTGATHANQTIDTLSINALTAGVTVGMRITGTDIPVDTFITSVTATTLGISKDATGSTGTVTFIITGGTSTSPLYGAGTTNTNGLPSVALAVQQFNDRAYYACAGVLYASDVLNPLQMTTATQNFTLGSSNDPIIALAPQQYFTTQSGGIVAALLAFKVSQIHQITGDLASNNALANKIADGVGTKAPRSVRNTTLGTMFVGPDGVRTVQLDGQISEANEDMTLPFLNPVYPSRIAAAYNIGFYRICSNFLEGGVMQTADFWFATKSKTWTGPHTITYDCISGGGATFFISGPSYTGQVLQSNAIPNEQTDFFTELGAQLSWVYETVVVPEFRPMPGWSITEASIFMGYQLQQIITAQVLQPNDLVLGSVALTTQFLAPSHPTNWRLNFTDATFNGGTVLIPSRHKFKLTGRSAANLELGTLFAHYQYQSDNNALDVVAYAYADLDFGSVADPVLMTIMDWGGVADSVLSSFDFETNGSHTGPP